jgi:FkbM family methyltransferase
LKRYVQATLKRAGIYHRLKASPVYDLYWTVADRRLIERRNKEIAFYRQFLTGFRRGDLIFDVGANVGDKTDIFLRLGSRVISVEPDEANQQVLRDRFLRYRFSPKKIVIVGSAVSNQTGVETMWIDGPGSAVNTLSGKWAETLKANKENFEHSHFGLEFGRSKSVATTTLEELFATHGNPVFVKIDVEGHEAKVIRGLNRPVPFLSFEVNLPEFRREGIECVQLLSALATTGTFNFSTDLQRGMAMESWQAATEFSSVLDQCSAKAIEVFWRTSQHSAGP